MAQVLLVKRVLVDDIVEKALYVALAKRLFFHTNVEFNREVGLL